MYGEKCRVNDHFVKAVANVPSINLIAVPGLTWRDGRFVQFGSLAKLMHERGGRLDLSF